MSGELIVPKDAPIDIIRAAVAYPRFVPGGRVEFACIYREARVTDISKGKIDEGETFEQARCAKSRRDRNDVSRHPIRGTTTTRTARASRRSWLLPDGGERRGVHAQ